MDWNFQSEFEYDWCLCALDAVTKELRKMKHARWLVFGQREDPVLEAFIRFLGFADHSLQLGFSLDILVEGEDLDAARRAYPFAEVRSIGIQTDPIRADYCLCWCGSHPPDLGQTEKFWKQVAQPEKRGLCVSDFRVYGPYTAPIAAAEGEFQQASARKAEALAGKSVVLRPGIVLGAGLDLSSPVAELLDRLVRQEKAVEISARTKYSLVYITDLFTALIQTALSAEAGTYNVSSPDNTVSLLRICEVYLQTAPGGQEISPVVKSAPGPSYALDGSKLKAFGWQPQVDLDTMIALEIAARRGVEGEPWFHDGHKGKLDLIQTCLFGMLCEVDRICKKHQIPYYLAGGTLLGAVRYQDFIPWDDDVDVMLLRPDYERFLAAAQTELPEQLFLQTPATEAGNHYLISKLRLTDTVFASRLLMDFPTLHSGVFLDIIAQDYTANTALGQRLHLALSRLARGLVYRKWSGKHLILRFLPFGLLEWFQHRVLTLFDGRPHRKFLYDSMGANLSKGVYPAQWLCGQVDVTFHGREFPAPAEYSRYLRYLYGDYTHPVPITRRRCCHDAVRVDLGPYAQK